MPELRDLHDVFARLEREVPDSYRSPIVADRVGSLLGQPVRLDRHPRRWVTTATALLAAAAVIAIAVASVALFGHHTSAPPAVHQPTISQSTSPTPTSSPSASTTSQAPTQHSTPTSDAAMPSTRSALLAYVRGAPTVDVSQFQQAEPGPGQAMRPTPGMAEFNTPSGNISCAILDGEGPNPTAVTCTAKQFSFHIPSKPASCQNNWAAYFGFVAGAQVTEGACVGGPEFGPTTSVLQYGSAIERGGVACRSESGFLACADLSTGRGFAVNRSVLKTY